MMNQVEKPAPTSSDRYHLFLISFLLLFFELVVIRWIPANIRTVGYYSNLVLVSCFLGFGLGCILRRTRDLFIYFPLLALVQLVISLHLGSGGINNPGSGGIYLFGGGGRYGWLVAVPVIFVVNALPFICIGQKLAQYLDRFRPIPGYTINIAGSLVGTTAFAAVSFLELRPTWWFAIAFALAMIFLARPRWHLLVGGAMLIAGGLVVHLQAANALWSPYYKIEVEALEPLQAKGQRIVVNHDYHQLVLDLSERAARIVQDHRAWQLTYDFPYLMRGEGRSDSVLVLGAGAGNDTAAALRQGASRVQAVELDPMIYQLGLELHPERPYHDPRVQMAVNDARNFVRRERSTYDLVVLGWLDSHRLFSSFSNVRQDNFMYTVEALRATSELLAPGGELCLSFYSGRRWVGAKIFAMLRQAFGHDPSVYSLAEGAYGEDGLIFMIGRSAEVGAQDPVNGFADLTEEYRALADEAVPPTDDWPYLYYRDRSISKEYLVMSLIVIGLAALMVGPALKSGSIGARQGVHFMLLGAGFLLLEVRNITLLALIFGSTWLTTSVVIAAVLLMILVANWVVERGLAEGRRRLAWALLLGSIVLSLVWREDLLPLGSGWLSAVLTTVVVSSTFVFAGVVFAGSFARVRVPSTALGFNVLGSVVGGMTEYASLLVGVSGLSLIALCLYLLALRTDH